MKENEEEKSKVLKEEEKVSGVETESECDTSLFSDDKSVEIIESNE